MAGYRDTFEYKLIYVMTIPDEEHKGLLKIGEATARVVFWSVSTAP